MKSTITIASWTLLLLLVTRSFAQPSGQQAEKGSQQQEMAAQQKLAPIPLAEINLEAEAVSLELEEARGTLASTPAEAEITAKFPIVLDSLQALKRHSARADLKQLGGRQLVDLTVAWTQHKRQLDAWQKTLIERVQVLEQERSRLQRLREVWDLTKESAAVRAQEPLQDRIASVLVEIDAVRLISRQRMEMLITLQNVLTEQALAITGQISRIEAAQQELQKELFVRDHPPLWRALAAPADSLNLAAQFTRAWTASFNTNREFFKENVGRFVFHCGIFAASLAFMLWLRRRIQRGWSSETESPALQAVSRFTSRPVAAALLLAMFFTLWIYPNRPVAFTELVLFLALVPLLRVVPGMMPREMSRPVYILAGLYAFDLLHSMVPAQFLLGRLLLLLETLAAFMAVWWLFGPKSRMDNLKARPLWKLLIRPAPIAMLALAGSIIANVVGAMALAKQLTTATLNSANFTIILFVVVALLTSLVAILFQRKILQALYLIQSYGSMIEKRLLNFLWIAAAFIWLRAILKIWGVYLPVVNWLTEALSHEWVFGAVKISMLGVLNVLFTLGIALLLARFMRLLLEKEIFVRIRLPRGIAGAISMVVRYTIVGFGIFLAIASTGVDLGKFGLIAGALGVGLGFGLQNVISNFVSGLILAFERPIQVGDSVEVGNVQGKVSQIGVRSSTIATFDGAEVIVPNSDLISNQVSNWTLSDRKRRMQLPVKVAFGSDPHHVLDLLVSVTRQHSGVLGSPEPVAVFNGFGDYYLDFMLYYWVFQDDYLLKTKSEVALGVHDRLRAAGIATPTPLRNLNLKLVNDGTKDLGTIENQEQVQEKNN